MITACARNPDRAAPAPDRAPAVGALAREALVRELELTPKPGLVDRAHTGSHRDMDFATMRASIGAIAGWLPLFFERGRQGAALAARAVLATVRADGLACERAMFAATRGVNTHKGGIFSMGLLCAAAGRLDGRGEALAAGSVCAEVARLADGLVERELAAACESRTAGERFYRAHGLPGARGEAQAGFATARRYGIPAYREALAAGEGEERALIEALLALMAHNGDTNVVARGGLEGLAFVQGEALALKTGPWPSTPGRIAQLHRLDRAFVARNLSPGGSADLLAVSWFLARLEDVVDGPGTGR